MTQTENLDPNWAGEHAIYREHIIDHYKNPRNFGILAQWTHHGKEVNPVCGDNLEVFVKLDQKKIADVRFRGKGCAISIAAMSLITDQIKGKAVNDVNKMNKEDVVGLLGINLGVVRLKCGLLGLNTLKKCMREVQS